MAGPITTTSSSSTTGATPAFPITGFFAGLLLAFGLIVAAFVYLARFLDPLLQPLGGEPEVKVSEVVLFANLMRMKMCLLIAGITTGVALMFLGLPLFLVGFNNTMVVTSEKYATKILGATPGILAILGGGVLVGYCCSQQFHVDRWTDPQGPKGAGEPPPKPGPSPGGGSWQFANEESKILELLYEDMSKPNACRAEFRRTAHYLYTLYAGLAAAIPDKSVPADQQQAKTEYARISKAFEIMRDALTKDDARPGEVANSFIRKDGNKTTIRIPDAPPKN